MAKNWVVHPPLDERRELRREQAAYIAAFADGEGTIRFRLIKRDGRDSNLSHGWNVQFELFNTNLAVLETIREWAGVGAIYGRECRKPGHKEAYHWGVYSQKAIHVLRQIVPYLIVKKRRAEIVLKLDALRQSRKTGNWVCYTDDDLTLISSLLEEIKRANETGSLDVKLLHRPEDSETVRYVRPPSERIRPGVRPSFCSVEGCGKRILKGAGGLCTEHAKQKSADERRHAITCEECGKEVETLEERARFCSPACQARNAHTRRTGKARVIREWGARKLTDAQKQEMRELYATDQFSQAELGRRFQVSPATAREIVKPKAEQPNPTRTCNVCGIEFEATDVRMRSCSRKCCLRYQKMKIKQRAQEAALPLE